MDTLTLATVLVAVCLVVPVAALTDYERLHTDLLTGYNAEVWPVPNASDTILDIGIGMALHQIISVEENQHILFSRVWLHLAWQDDRLKWNTSEYGDIARLTTTTRIWTPDIILYDDARAEERPLDSYSYQISNTGSISYYLPMVYRSKCLLNVRYFPFDEQSCPFRFTSWSYTGFHINVYNTTSEGLQDVFESNGEWHLLDIPVQTNVVYYDSIPGVPFPDVTYTVKFKRLSSYYVTNLIVPIVLMSILTLANFLMPAESGEKASVSVTLFLSLVVFGIVVQGYMPVQADGGIPLLTQYLLATLILMAISTALNIYIISLHHRGQYGTQVPLWVKFYLLYKLGKILGFGSIVEKYRSRDSKILGVREFTFHHTSTQPNKLSPDIQSTNTITAPCAKSDDHLQRALLYEIKQLNKYKCEEEQLEVVRLEWSLVANVINMLLFYIFLVILIGVSIILVVASAQ